MIEKKLAGEFKLCSGLEDDMCDVVKGDTNASTCARIFIILLK